MQLLIYPPSVKAIPSIGATAPPPPRELDLILHLLTMLIDGCVSVRLSHKPDPPTLAWIASGMLAP